MNRFSIFSMAPLQCLRHFKIQSFYFQKTFLRPRFLGTAVIEGQSKIQTVEYYLYEMLRPCWAGAVEINFENGIFLYPQMLVLYSFCPTAKEQ